MCCVFWVGKFSFNGLSRTQTLSHPKFQNAHPSPKSFFIPLTFTLDKCCSLHRAQTNRFAIIPRTSHDCPLMRNTSVRGTSAIGRQRRQTITGIGSRTRIHKLLIVLFFVLLLLAITTFRVLLQTTPQRLLRQPVARARARPRQIRALHRGRIQHRIARTLAVSVLFLLLVLVPKLVQTAVAAGWAARRAERRFELLLRVGQKV